LNALSPARPGKPRAAVAAIGSHHCLKSQQSSHRSEFAQGFAGCIGRDPAVYTLKAKRGLDGASDQLQVVHGRRHLGYLARPCI
jgi:hypothetical protein